MSHLWRGAAIWGGIREREGSQFPVFIVSDPLTFPKPGPLPIARFPLSLATRSRDGLPAAGPASGHGAPGHGGVGRQPRGGPRGHEESCGHTSRKQTGPRAEYRI